MNITATLLAETREEFELRCWDYYQNLKAKGWSSPEEGDSTCRDSLFWQEPSGMYGVRQIEAAWRGWLMAKGYL